MLFLIPRCQFNQIAIQRNLKTQLILTLLKWREKLLKLLINQFKGRKDKIWICDKQHKKQNKLCDTRQWLIQKSKRCKELMRRAVQK